MKLKKKHSIVIISSVITLFLLAITILLGEILNIFSASTGLAHSNLQTIGRFIAYGLRENNAFPGDWRSDDESNQAAKSNQWYSLFDVKALLSETGKGVDKDIPKDFFDAKIWTVAKNIPENPPPNLIILATRNVEPSSLRTRLADEDMQKKFGLEESLTICGY